MDMTLAMRIIFFIAVFGMCFSGYLTYKELFAPTPGGAVCPTPGAAGTVFGYPACVYGFFMYLLIVLISGAALFL